MRIKSKFKLKKLFRAMLLIVVSLFLVAFFFEAASSLIILVLKLTYLLLKLSMFLKTIQKLTEIKTESQTRLILLMKPEKV